MILVLWAGLVLVLTYEIWTIYTKDEGDTISEMVWTLSTERPVIPFAFGFLMGHFFW